MFKLADFFFKVFNFNVAFEPDKTSVLIQYFPSDIIDSEICRPILWWDGSWSDVNDALTPKIANRVKIDKEGYSFVITVNEKRENVALLLRNLLQIDFDAFVSDPVFIKFRNNSFNAFPFFYKEEDRYIYETEDYSSTKIVVSILPEG